MSDKSSESIVAAATVEASRLLRAISPPIEGANIKSRIARAARRVGWSPSRARDVWYRDPRIRIAAHEMDAVRRAARTPEAAARDELAELRATVERLERYLVAVDPDAAGVRVDPFRLAVRPANGADRPVNRTMVEE